MPYWQNHFFVLNMLRLPTTKFQILGDQRNAIYARLAIV